MMRSADARGRSNMDKYIQAMLDQLPEIAERTKAQLEDLHREPSAVRAEIMLTHAIGVANHIRRISDEMRRPQA